MPVVDRKCGYCESLILFEEEGALCGRCGAASHHSCLSHNGEICPLCNHPFEEPEVNFSADKIGSCSTSSFGMPFKSLLIMGVGIGSIFTLLFFAMWYRFFVGEMDLGGAIFLSFVECLTLPLLIGSTMLLRRNMKGLVWFLFGSFIFIVRPLLFARCLKINRDPEFLRFMSEK